MLPRKNRLLKDDSFSLVKKRGKRINGNAFNLSFLNRGGERPSRFGFIVSSKISKKAVERNRIKRLLRLIIKELLEDINGGHDIVIIAKKGALKIEKQKAKEEIASLLERQKLL